MTETDDFALFREAIKGTKKSSKILLSQANHHVKKSTNCVKCKNKKIPNFSFRMNMNRF